MSDKDNPLICQSVHFLSKGDRLAAQLFIPDLKDRAPVMLICHGLFSFKENYFEFAEYLAKRGIAVLTMDMRGHGQSGGERFAFCLSDWIANIQAAIDFLVKHPRIDPLRIAGFGLSSGGTAILEAAIVESRLKVLVTLSASIHNDHPLWQTVIFNIMKYIGIIYKKFKHRSFRLSLPWVLDMIDYTADATINADWRTNLRVREAFHSIPFPETAEALLIDTIHRVKLIRIPTLVLHGATDRLESPQNAQLLYRALVCVKEIHTIPSSGHLGHLDWNRHKIFELTYEWIANKLL